LLAAVPAWPQVRPQIRVVETITLHTQQILQGETHGTPTAIAGELRIPPIPGRLPAVIFLHGSLGLGPSHEQWADDLNALGIAVFLLDSFSSRGITSTVDDQTQLDALAMMVDAYRALGMLSRHPRIDMNRVAVMGWSKGAHAAVYASMERFQKSYAPPNVQFQAHIGLFTPCYTTYKDELHVTGKPIRLFHGTADDYTPIGPCRAYVERLRSAGVDISLTEYPGAQHSYDSRGDLTQFPNGMTARNCSMIEGDNGVILNATTRLPWTYSDACVERGPHIGYNDAATQATKRAVTDFLIATFGLQPAASARVPR
jgi:dienelactone hydrolase